MKPPLEHAVDISRCAKLDDVLALTKQRDRQNQAAALRKAADVAVYANLAEQLRDMADRIERGE